MESARPETGVEIASESKRDLRATWVLAAASAAIALATAMVGLKALDKSGATAVHASAAPDRGAGRFQRPISGIVASIEGSLFVVKATGFRGSTTNIGVSTSKDTTYHESTAGALGDLKRGDRVIVTGPTTDGVVMASRISQVSTGNRASGEITSIDGDSLTLASASGLTTVVRSTNATTIIVTKPITFKDLNVGDTVRVTGDSSGATVKASDVTRGEMAGGFSRGSGRRGSAPPAASPTSQS